MNATGNYLFTFFDIETYPNYFCFVAMDYDEYGNHLETYIVESKDEKIMQEDFDIIEAVFSGHRNVSWRTYTQHDVLIIDEINQDGSRVEDESVVNVAGGLIQSKLPPSDETCEHYIVSFNGARFDLPVLAKMRLDVSKLGLTTTKFIHNHAQELITYDKSNNRMSRSFAMNKNWNRKHFDMLTNCLLSKSLKQWEMYTGLDIKELPFDPMSPIDDKQQMEVREYCAYDTLALSQLFWKYGYNKSLSGKPTFTSYRELFLMLPPLLQDRFDRTPSKLAVASIYHDLSMITPKTSNPFELFDIDKFRVEDGLKALIYLIEHLTPEQRKGYDFIYNGIDYGTGGAHYIKTGFHSRVLNYDVSSMYPSILIQLSLLKTPEARERYSNFRDRRMAIKHSPELSALSEGLKLALNSFSGELRSKSPYLASYDPAAGNAMCYFGQLFITEFISKIDLNDLIEVNTDGAMCLSTPENEIALDRQAEYLHDTYGLSFEKEKYDYIYARDVNNYCIYDSEGNFVKGKGDRWSDYRYKGHINAVTKILFDNLIQYNLSIDWSKFKWTDFIYKYHKSAASKYAAIDGQPMEFKNYYMLWTNRNVGCPITFSRDLINKKNGSIKARWGVWSQSLDELYKYAQHIDFDQYHRDLDDDFELWGRSDLCQTRLPKSKVKMYKSLSDFFPAL